MSHRASEARAKSQKRSRVKDRKLADRVNELLKRAEGFDLEFAARRSDPAFLLETTHDANGGFDRGADLLGQLALGKRQDHSMLFLKRKEQHGQTLFHRLLIGAAQSLDRLKTLAAQTANAEDQSREAVVAGEKFSI